MSNPSYSFSHRDDPDIHDLFEVVLEHKGMSQSEWVREMKRDLLLDLDELPQELADELADDYEAKADAAETQAEDLRERLAEKEAEADEYRERADRLRDLGDADISLEPEEDGTAEETFRDQVVARLARQVESSQSVTLSTNEDVRNLAREEDADRNAEWLGELRSEIEDAADVAAEDLDIEITAAEAATGW